MSVPPPLPPKNRTSSAQATSAPPPQTQTQTFESNDFFNPSFTASGINTTTQYTSSAQTTSAPPPLPPKNKSAPPSNPVPQQNPQTSRNTPPISKPVPQPNLNNVVASDVFDSPFEDPFQYQQPRQQVSQYPAKPTSSAYNPPIYSPPSHTTYNTAQPSSTNPPLPQKKPPQNNSSMFLDNQQGSGPSLNFNTTTSVKASTVLSASQPYQSPEVQTASNYIPSSMLDKSIPLDVKMNMSLSNPDTVNVNVNGVNAKVPTKTMLKVASTAASVGVASYQQSNKKQ